jgi:hypothetical protein
VSTGSFGGCLLPPLGKSTALLIVVCCLLFVVCCLLFVVCCLLFVVCCLLFALPTSSERLRYFCFVVCHCCLHLFPSFHCIAFASLTCCSSCTLQTMGRTTTEEVSIIGGPFFAFFLSFPHPIFLSSVTLFYCFYHPF